MDPVTFVSPDGTPYRDLNRNGVMDPYEDPRLTPEERAEDLVGRLSLAEKVGLMFHTVIEMDRDGALLERPGAISKSPTSQVVLGKLMNHFNVHGITDGATAARWSNTLQRLAEQTPHGIPVTISSDPRHAFAENVGVGFSGGPFSQWPDSLGLAAIDEPETTEAFAAIVREEYVAVGIRAALHPQVDLATDPRWCRQLQTFGADSGRSAAHTAAYLTGLQGPIPGTGSVACTTKHFPGGGPQKDGEEAHFPYGKNLVYPAGRFEEHLEPFRAAIAHGTAGIMPGYGIPTGLVLDGEPVEEVGIGFNRQLLQGLLREAMGFDGVILTDWELINDNHVGDQVLPARAWGVEELTQGERLVKMLDAGVDQVGGEECVEALLGLVRDGMVAESRIDESVRRLLLVKFRLGLFDNPYVDEDVAATVPGCHAHREAGRLAQSRSVVVLENREVHGRRTLPLAPGTRVYLEGIDPATPGLPGPVVATPEEADVAIVRIGAPFDPRDDLFLESFFHQGSLEFRPGLIHRLKKIAAAVPLVVDVALDRAAVLTPVSDVATGLTVTFGVSDGSLVEALTGKVPPVGRLPIGIPVSMDAVRAVESDAGLEPAACLYPIGSGLALGAHATS